MGPAEMIVLVVAILAGAWVLRAKYAARKDGAAHGYQLADGEARQLRDQVNHLKERIQVLERIATDRESSLEREIERLRDR